MSDDIYDTYFKVIGNAYKQTELFPKKKYIPKKQKEKNDKLKKQASEELQCQDINEINIKTTLNYDSCHNCPKFYYYCDVITEIKDLCETKSKFNLDHVQLKSLHNLWMQARMKQAKCYNSRKFMKEKLGYDSLDYGYDRDDSPSPREIHRMYIQENYGVDFNE